MEAVPEGDAGSEALPPGHVTRLIGRMRAGSEAAAGELYELVRDELHRLAHRQLRQASPGHTFDTTSLLHEAWLRLVGEGQASFRDRGHFLAVAARAMRFVLVDHARRNARQKRGGDRVRVPLDDALESYEERSHDLVELDDALEVLAGEQARQAKVVELRFFAGLSIEESAEALGISSATVERDWRLARMWLMDRLGSA